MATPQPLILDGLSIRDLIEYILKQRVDHSSLIVCGTRDGFVEQLTLADTQQIQDQPAQQGEPSREQSNADQLMARSPMDSWSTPTLRLLLASRALKLVFCPDIMHLRAYLSSRGARHLPVKWSDRGAAQPTTHLLALLNPIQLHRSTSAFSAQGLHRTFSAAVEAAFFSASQLLVAECRADKPLTTATDELSTEQGEVPSLLNGPTNIWDEEVSILNVTTKSFGAGERGWVGRTVKLRTVAERWFAFNASRQPLGE